MFSTAVMLSGVTVNEAVENVIEANILISGIGFESGGLAASHGIAQAFPLVPFLHKKYLHGEMVAIGVITHQCMEQDQSEGQRIAEFFSKIGLPTHLGHLSLDINKNSSEIDLIIDEAMNIFFLHHEPFEVTPHKIKKALMEANDIGIEVTRNFGDNAYRMIHGKEN